ncbi:hypothetical protein [Elizabethkingia sp. JS20170427COW]|uniref:hypothetical protein n=1 Tax=Elizabethkingia sp. JS20170427COW TaxID=2583851 RepID=UPI00111092E1|nr:hypothetical protein [Elizabethkingia sp. JS20170427COW]QCX53532.1 hypothetical protein FGE20_07210 [Elizabethkingia sp. JS20170427COW]
MMKILKILTVALLLVFVGLILNVFYQKYQLKKNVASAKVGSLFFIKNATFSDGAEKDFILGYKINRIEGDTIFATSINSVDELPYNTLSQENYQELLKKGKTIKPIQLSVTREAFEQQVDGKEKVLQLYPSLKNTTYYQLIPEEEKFMFSDFYRQQKVRRWTNETSKDNNYSHQYYPEITVSDIDAVVK